MTQALRNVAGKLFFSPRGKTPTQIAAQLREAGVTLSQWVQQCPDTEYHRRVLSHIIGIERWGQRRLRSALGDPLVIDDYDGYRPARDASWDMLKAEFARARADTVALAEALERVGDRVVPHNSYGNLTVREWLRYLLLHAALESRRIR